MWAKEIPYRHDNIKSFSKANAVAGLFWITVKGEGEGRGEGGWRKVAECLGNKQV